MSSKYNHENQNDSAKLFSSYWHDVLLLIVIELTSYLVEHYYQ